MQWARNQRNWDEALSAFSPIQFRSAAKQYLLNIKHNHYRYAVWSVFHTLEDNVETWVHCTNNLVKVENAKQEKEGIVYENPFEYLSGVVYDWQNFKLCKMAQKCAKAQVVTPWPWFHSSTHNG